MKIYILASLGGSLVLGGAALVAARVWTPPPAKAAAGPVAPPPRMRPVVVASQALAYGAKLDAGKLAVRYVPPDAAPDGAFTTIADVMARDGGKPLVLTPLAAQEALLPSKVSGPGARVSVATQISDGMRAYAIAITDKSGVGGNALPGDWVDVVLARELPASTPGKQAVTSEVVLQNARVLGIDRNADPSSTETALPSTATLEVKLEDTQKLAMAELMGTLSLALRKTGSAEVATVRPLHASNASLTDLSASPVRATSKPTRIATVVASSGPMPAAPDPVISIRSGDQQSRISVPRDRNLIILGSR